MTLSTVLACDVNLVSLCEKLICLGANLVFRGEKLVGLGVNHVVHCEKLVVSKLYWYQTCTIPTVILKRDHKTGVNAN